jgi:hypothetical protein
LMPWVEKITDKLLGWKAALMNKAGRAALARFVLLAMPIYRLIAINVPKWFIRLVNKIRRGFVWKGRENANGGCCIVAWDKVQWPIDLGDLGIHNLETMGWALQMRWQWLKKNSSRSPLGGFGTSLSCKYNGTFRYCNNDTSRQWDEHFVLV